MVGLQMRVGEEDKEHQRHPAEQADLEGDHRERVGLQRRDHAIADAEPAHCRDREVLEGDPEYERQREVGDVLGPQRDTRDRHSDGEQHPLRDQVPERAPRSAMRVADPHRHRERVVVSVTSLLAIARAVQAAPVPVRQQPQRAGIQRRQRPNHVHDPDVLPIPPDKHVDSDQPCAQERGRERDPRHDRQPSRAMREP
jgi:hypothetical protein